MNDEWFSLVERHTLAGARSKFEKICLSLFRKMYPDKTVRSPRLNPGDGGIDIFIGEIGVEPIKVIQCKFFPNKDFGEVQYRQIRESFKTANDSDNYEMKDWTLCVFSQLDLKENIWWSNWKHKTIKNNGFHKG